ncbi:MAG TPA: CehA/McbA family metallohydrolase, partial [Pirellulaceae bacterium]
RFPGRLGNGLWVEFIYSQALNAGLRITPVAGSGSGLVPNPAGQNRVYARIRGEPTWDSWLRALRGGQVLVTNGPLMTPSVNGELPGHTFKASAGQTVSLQASLALYTREKIAYFELIRDGRVVESVPLEQWVGDRGRLPKVEFERSGWMMLRAVTKNKQTLRYVSTGPYYVEIGGQPAISRRAADFFLDWTRDRTQTIRLGDADDQAELLRDHRSAIQFWERRRELANLD